MSLGLRFPRRCPSRAAFSMQGVSCPPSPSLGWPARQPLLRPDTATFLSLRPGMAGSGVAVAPLQPFLGLPGPAGGGGSRERSPRSLPGHIPPLAGACVSEQGPRWAGRYRRPRLEREDVGGAAAAFRAAFRKGFAGLNGGERPDPDWTASATPGHRPYLPRASCSPGPERRRNSRPVPPVLLGFRSWGALGGRPTRPVCVTCNVLNGPA